MPPPEIRMAMPGDADVVARLLFDFNTEFESPTPTVEELYVRPELRDQGIGTALLDGSLVWAVAAGAGEMHIGVDPVRWTRVSV